MAKHYNFIYEELVRYDGDMVGRIAYSLYKREKIAFIEQYKKANDGRDPSTKDFDNFHATCHNPERIRMYRNEALAMLQDFMGESFEETSKQILADFTKDQDEHLTKVIKPLLPTVVYMMPTCWKKQASDKNRPQVMPPLMSLSL